MSLLLERRIDVKSLFMRLPGLANLPPVPPEADSGRSVDVAGRPAAPALAELLDLAFAGGWDVARVERELFDDPTVTATYVVYDAEVAVATASARLLTDTYPQAGYLHWVASSPRARGRGLGRAVIVAVLKRFHHDGMTQAVLETDDHRLAAIRLYLSMGFVPVYRGGDDESRWSAVFRRLAEHPAKASQQSQ
jgi:mycothiol synthase